MSQNERFVEGLEDRVCPAAIMATLSGSTLNIVGDADNNEFTITGDAMDPAMFTLDSATDTINGSMSAMFEGVTNISIKLLDGDDKVTFTDTVPIHLLGSLKFNGGDGGNALNATSTTIDKGMSVTNGDGEDFVIFRDSTINGNATVKNGDGGSSFQFIRNTAGVCTINGDLKITNGTGEDNVFLSNANVFGDIAVKNGASDGASAGFFLIFNTFNPDTRSFVGGDISVSYKDGSVSYDGIWDYEIMGNVKFSYGKGSSELYVDGFSTTLPVVIHGNLSIKGTGDTYISVGQRHNDTGLILGGNLSVTGGAGVDNLQFDFLSVGGATKLKLGEGDNTVSTNESSYSGAVSMSFGNGANTVLIEALAGSLLPTQFSGPVKLKAGNGGNTFNLAGPDDSYQQIILLSTFVVDPGDGMNTIANYPAKEYGPFGNYVEIPI